MPTDMDKENQPLQTSVVAATDLDAGYLEISFYQVAGKS